MPTTRKLTNQLAEVLRAGLNSKPELRASLAEALGLSVDEGSKPTPESKATKSEADYRESSSEEVRCGNCSYFEDRHCDLVSGHIRPDDVCDYYSSVKGKDDPGD